MWLMILGIVGIVIWGKFYLAAPGRHANYKAMALAPAITFLVMTALAVFVGFGLMVVS